MNQDLLALIARVRAAEGPEDLTALKELGESLLRKEKRYAILTLLAIHDEFGDKELLGSLKELVVGLETELRERRMP